MSMRRATSLLSGRTQAVTALRELLGTPVAIEEYVVRARAVLLFAGCCANEMCEVVFGWVGRVGGGMHGRSRELFAVS
jgi:hypothetical protein